MSAVRSAALCHYDITQCSLFIVQKGGEGLARTRNFASVVYPESAPEDWQGILAAQLVPSLISPLHDKDLDAEGKLKKPHYHVLLLFSGVKTREQAAAVFAMIGGVGCEQVNSARAYARYLIHADQSDKAQYDRRDIVALSGADYESLARLPDDRYKAISEIVDFCSRNDMNSYSDLLEYCREKNWAWFCIMCDNSVTIREYLRSRAWTHREG